jgi:hypothetical protein
MTRTYVRLKILFEKIRAPDVTTLSGTFFPKMLETKLAIFTQITAI